MLHDLEAQQFLTPLERMSRVLRRGEVLPGVALLSAYMTAHPIPELEIMNLLLNATDLLISTRHYSTACSLFDAAQDYATAQQLFVDHRISMAQVISTKHTIFSHMK